MYGFPSKIKSKSSHPIIEDVCQSLGAKINNKKVGLQTDIGIFSFYATKLITSAGQGGMIISRNSSLISEIRDFLNFDQRQDNKKRFNFNMTDVQAAMGIVQLRRIREFLEKRERKKGEREEGPRRRREKEEEKEEKERKRENVEKKGRKRI